jgi:hypothetical protein
MPGRIFAVQQLETSLPGECDHLRDGRRRRHRPAVEHILNRAARRSASEAASRREPPSMMASRLPGRSKRHLRNARTCRATMDTPA